MKHQEIVRNLQKKIIGVGIVCFLHLMAWMPRPLRVRIGNILGDLTRHVMPRTKRVVQTNFDIAFNDLSVEQRTSMLFQHFRQLGQSFVELGPLWFWDLRRSLELVRSVRGVEAVDAALAEGNGVVLFTAHLGSWEAVVQFIGQRWPITVLYKPTRNATINAHMLAGRSRSGARLVPKDSGLRALMHSLQNGEMIGILPDQNVDEREGVFASFFSRPACTSPILARLAKRRKSPVFGVFAYRIPNGRGFEIDIIPLDREFPSGNDVDDVTVMNRVIERSILRAPDQYWWVHRRYKCSPQGLEYPYDD